MRISDSISIASWMLLPGTQLTPPRPLQKVGNGTFRCVCGFEAHYTSMVFLDHMNDHVKSCDLVSALLALGVSHQEIASVVIDQLLATHKNEAPTR